MALQHVSGMPVAEGIDDVADWLTALEGCPSISRTEVLRCADPSHADEAPTWFYVEADREAGVARTRCLAGGHVRHLADSESRWSFPNAWSCRSCRQMIAEVMVGVHDVVGEDPWLVLAGRCIECGNVEGLTDIVAAAP